MTCLGDDRVKAYGLVRDVKAKAGEGVQQRVGGQRTGVVAAALNFVPWVAVMAFIFFAYRFNDGHTFVDQACLYHVYCSGVCETVHFFAGIDHRKRRLSRIIRPGTDIHGRFIVQRIGPPCVVVIPGGRFKIDIVGGLQGFSSLAGVEYFAQSIEIGVPLCDGHVDLAALVDLILDLREFFGPVLIGCGAVTAIDGLGVVAVRIENGFI